jgi:hypothetical protein
MMSAVNATQTGRHRSHGIGSIVPALAQNARTGHPQFRNGKGKTERVGHPPGAVPVVGEIWLAYQTGHALYEGGKAMSESINRCNGD